MTLATTLRTGALTLTAVDYKFDSNKLLTIRLTTTGAHKIYGDVNILLANVLAIDIHDVTNTLVVDFFNNTFKFKRITATTLEYSETISSGVTVSESFITLDNNGIAITATVNNSFFELPAGRHSFFLLDTDDSDFSTSKISIKQLNIGKSGVDGVESVFDELGAATYLSINNQDLFFSYPARISIKDDDSGVTNIPLIINT